MDFILGTHKPGWLATAGVPLMVSARRLRERVQLPRAIEWWVLDSGGFSELSLYGEWVTTARQYVREVRYWQEGVGHLRWVAPQDWMCEAVMLARTGLTVEDHQARTVASYLELRDHLGELVIPVLQGASTDDYWRCADLYQAVGVELASLPVVGLGSVCRRQRTAEIVGLAAGLAGAGLNLHGFGVKTDGLRQAGGWFGSADSTAWSITARRELVRLAGHAHQTCSNCIVWALQWRSRLLSGVGQDVAAVQLGLGV